MNLDPQVSHIESFAYAVNLLYYLNDHNYTDKVDVMEILSFNLAFEQTITNFNKIIFSCCY